MAARASADSWSDVTQAGRRRAIQTRSLFSDEDRRLVCTRTASLNAMDIWTPGEAERPPTRECEIAARRGSARRRFAEGGPAGRGLDDQGGDAPADGDGGQHGRANGVGPRRRQGGDEE